MLMLAKLMESAKALKMLPYSHIHATRSQGIARLLALILASPRQRTADQLRLGL
jgi:hypothetical protein